MAWTCINYEQRHPVRKDCKWWNVINDFRGLLQTRVQSLKSGNTSDASHHNHEHGLARLDQKFKTRHGRCPECYFLTWEHDLSWFICPHPQGFPSSHAKKRRRRVSGQTPYDLAKDKGQSQVMGLLRPASWQPFWSHDEDQQPWITYLTLLVWPMISLRYII